MDKENRKSRQSERKKFNDCVRVSFHRSPTPKRVSGLNKFYRNFSLVIGRICQEMGSSMEKIDEIHERVAEPYQNTYFCHENRPKKTS